MKKGILLIGFFILLAAVALFAAVMRGSIDVQPTNHTWHWNMNHPTPDPTPIQFASKNGNVQFEWKLGNPYLLKNGSGDVFLDLRVSGKAIENADRKRLNLVLVIDRSGSMASENKLEQVKQAAMEIVGNMTPQDRLAVVIYDDRVQTLIPSTAVKNIAALREEIGSIAPGGSTNLCGGMQAGSDEVRKNFREDYVNRIILLSDGLANAGITDPDQINAEAKRIRSNAVSVSTMGVGIDYNESLMANIADSSGGNYYYISQELNMADVFRKEWNLMQSVVATNAVARLRLADGVDVVDVAGFQWEKSGRNLTIQVPDVYAGQTKRILVQLKAPARSVTTEALGTGSFECKDVSAGTAKPIQFTFAPSIKVIEDSQMVAKNVDRDVNVKVESVAASKRMEEAYKLYESGDAGAAGRVANETIQKLNSLGYTEVQAQASRYDEFMKQANSPPAEVAPEAKKDMLKKQKAAERESAQSVPQ